MFDFAVEVHLSAVSVYNEALRKSPCAVSPSLSVQSFELGFVQLEIRSESRGCVCSVFLLARDS